MKPEGVIDESSLDAEALQAQIDLSMSFAQDLVSSWLDPSKFSKSSRKQDLEKELTDHMRRPPRLGVGAAVPAGHQASMSRETARLKGKLVGTKRPRAEEASTSKLPSNNDDDDDEGESRSHTIKKKAKVDPFDVVHNKKKKKQKHSTQEPSTPVKRSTPVPADEDSSVEVADLLLQSPTKSTVGDVASTTSSPKKSKKKKKKGIKERSDTSNALASNALATVASDSETKLEEEDAYDNSNSAHVDAISADSVLGTPLSPKKKGPFDISKISLLNLTGPPPSDDDSGVEAEGASATSPKKKRKRRKKKKIAIANSNENAMDVDDA